MNLDGFKYQEILELCYGTEGSTCAEWRELHENQQPVLLLAIIPSLCSCLVLTAAIFLAVTVLKGELAKLKEVETMAFAMMDGVMQAMLPQKIHDQLECGKDEGSKKPNEEEHSIGHLGSSTEGESKSKEKGAKKEEDKEKGSKERGAKKEDDKKEEKEKGKKPSKEKSKEELNGKQSKEGKEEAKGKQGKKTKK